MTNRSYGRVPLRVSSHSDPSTRVFSEDEARRVIEEAVSYLLPTGKLWIQLSSWWGAGQRWARNRAALTTDQREVTLFILRKIGNVSDFKFSSLEDIHGLTNQTDSESLKGICAHVDYYYTRWKEKTPPDMIVARPSAEGEGAEVWADSTFDRSLVDNANAVEQLTRTADAEQLMSAGYIETTGSTALRYTRDEWGRTEWHWGHVTQAQCSVTVRDPGGNGSGWAGKTSFDINRVDIAQISSRALERCKKSLNPVRIEPGRYQVILEPQATATLTTILVYALERYLPEQRAKGPFFLGLDKAIDRYKSKIGLKIIDDRLSIFHDPTDPLVGSHVAPLHQRAEFVRNGVLTGLWDNYLNNLNEVSTISPNFRTTSYTMAGGHTSIEEMISSSKRALLVSRLTQPEVIDEDSLLLSGFTRDGLWLIENGVVTKAVRNFRWTESPLFVLNNIETIGVEEQVFDPVMSRNPLSSFSESLNNVVVPPLKVNDFSFTSTIDAI